MNKDNNYIKIFDTTLRDGEQSPGASMNIEEKLKIAEALEDLKVDIIEAGFPAASKGDYDAVSEISKQIKNSSICALSRASKNDIQTAADALKNAAAPRIHTFISTSELHMKHKLQLNSDKVYQKVIDSVSFAGIYVMTLSGLVRMELGQIWTLCVKPSKLQLRTAHLQ